MIETEAMKGEIGRWSKLAIQLNGQAESGEFGDMTTDVVMQECRSGDVFALLSRRLPASVWEISKLTDVDRHKLSAHWRAFAIGYDARQFHVRSNGLSL